MSGECESLGNHDDYILDEILSEISKAATKELQSFLLSELKLDLSSILTNQSIILP